MPFELIHNLALLVAFCSLSGFVLRRWPPGSKRGPWIQGLLFGAAALIGMSSPIHMSHGIFFDGRSVILSLAAWYFGLEAALISGAMALVMRIHLGGSGMPAGVMVIAASSLIGLAFRGRFRPDQEPVGPWRNLAFGWSVHLVMVLILLAMLPPVERDGFRDTMLIHVLLWYPLATLLAGSILADQHARHLHLSALEASEAKFRKLFEESQAVMLIIDPADGRIVEANRAAARFYGLPPERLRTLRIQDINTLTPEEIRARMEQARTRSCHLFRFQHRVAGGAVRDVEVYSGPVLHQGRECLYSIIIDVSDRVSYEQGLTQALAEREAVLHTALDGFCMVDGKGTVLEVNEACCTLFGYSREEFLAGHGPEAADAVGETLVGVLSRIPEGGALRAERRFRRKDDTVLTVEISARAIRGESGSRTCCFIRDLTEQHRSQALIRLHSAALAAAANSIVITDLEGRIVWANEAFTRSTGYGLEEAIGHTPGELLKSGRHEADFYRNMWETILRGEVWSSEIVNRRKDGSLFPELMTITPLFEEGGRVTHFIAIKQDLSEKKQLEGMFLKAQRLESVGTLTSGLAHDLNNILSPIVLSAELLQGELPEGNLRDLAGVIVASARRGVGVVRQLLSFARDGSGDKRELHLDSLVREALRVFRETFPRNIRIVDTAEPGLWPVRADPTRIHQVLANLLVNARDALEGKGGEIQVSLSNQIAGRELAALHPPARPGRHVVLRVSDTGCGIAPENMGKLFQPFFTTKDPGKGTGLGLPSSLAIVRGYGGLMRVESELGRGTVVEVWLPASSAGQDGASPEPAGGGPKKGRERVLVVDDEESVGQMLHAILQGLGYQVEIVHGGEEALARLGALPPIDAMILDWMMPGRGGEWVLAGIEARGLRLPVLVISGIEGEGGGPPTGLNGRPFLAKPFSIDQLARSLREILDAKKI